ncbi:MAG: diguanylate cyclase [Candidatus Rifleibacteriota bacterium]
MNSPQQTLQFYNRLAEKSANTKDLHQLIDSIIDETIHFLDADSGSIMVYDQNENCLRLFASKRHPRIKSNNSSGAVAKIGIDHGIAGEVFSSGKPVIVSDLSKYDQKLRLNQKTAKGSFLSLPLKINNKIIGVMNLNRPPKRKGFCEQDLKLLASVETTIAGLIEKEKLVASIDANRREISSLYSLSRILIESTNFYAGLETFLEKLSEFLNLERSAVIKIPENYKKQINSEAITNTEIEIIAANKLEKKQLTKMFHSVSSRLKNQLTMPWTKDTSDFEKPPLSLSFEENAATRELFCIPLIVEGNPSHMLLVSRRYLENDIEKAKKHYRFLYLIAQNLSMSLEKEKMIERIHEDQDMLLANATRNRIFLEISKDLASTLDPLVILQKAFNQFSAVISYTSIAILLFDDLDETYRLITQPTISISKSYQESIADNIFKLFQEFPTDPELTRENFAKPVIFKPQQVGGKPKRTFEQTLHLPIIIGDRVAGLIHLSRAENEPFTNHELDITSQFTGIFITSIKNALIHKRTEMLAFTDPLTGLFNHRYFQETLSHEFTRASRYSIPLSLMVMDIDFFKKFNDTYGHLVGDKVLRHVAGIFKNSIREQIDTVARYGGEEFAVILPETTLDGAQQFAERIRNTVEETTLMEEDKELSVTLSIGVACTRVTACHKTSDLVEAADNALYWAKEHGRNQVKTFEESTIENGS